MNLLFDTEGAVEAASPVSGNLSISVMRTDGGTQSRSAIYQNVVDDYAAAMMDGVAFPPVVVFFDGQYYWLADGFHRHAGAKKAGIEALPADVRQGTRREAILFSVGANASHGLRRTNEDKRRAVMTLLNDEEWAKWSNREIARRCGVSEGTVRNLRPDDTAQNTQYDTVVQRQYIHPKTGEPTTMSVGNIGKSGPEEFFPTTLPEPIVAPEVQRYDETQEREIIEAAKAIAAAKPEIRIEIAESVVSAEPDDKHVRGTLGTGENEWYTPAEHIAAAREVMGGVDLDPASSEIANRTVGAEKIFTLDDDGLKQEWFGRVWLNPPYAQPAIAHFSDKIVYEYGEGNVEQAIVLTHNYTDTAWFQKMARACSAMCFTRGRVRFVSPTGELAAPTQGQAFFYFGVDPSEFCRKFSEFGFVVRVVS